MVETNMTKEDLQKIKDDPLMKFASLFLDKNEMERLYKEVEKKLNEKKTSELPKKEEYVAPQIKVEPVKLVDDDTIWRKVKVQKNKFEDLVHGFATANVKVEELEANGFMFTEDSPIVMYENIISGLLRSIFGKDIASDICAYAYGDSDDNVKTLWDKIEKSI